MKKEMILDDTDRLLSLEEVRIRLKTSSRVVSKLINSGVLPVIKVNSSRRVRKIAFNEFLNKCDGQDLSEMTGGV